MMSADATLEQQRMKQPSLIVAGAGPLLALASTGSLNALLAPGLPVLIPDMVRFEATRDAGGTEVANWIRDHESSSVRVASTEVFEEFQALASIRPSTKITGRGEQAASEVLGAALANGHGAVLLFDDADIRKQNFLVRLPDNVLVISTSALLASERTRMTATDLAAQLPDAQRSAAQPEAIATGDPDQRRLADMIRRHVTAVPGPVDFSSTRLQSSAAQLAWQARAAVAYDAVLREAWAAAQADDEFFGSVVRAEAQTDAPTSAADVEDYLARTAPVYKATWVAAHRPDAHAALVAFSRGEISRGVAMERLQIDWYGDLLRLLDAAGLERWVVPADQREAMVADMLRVLGERDDASDAGAPPAHASDAPRDASSTDASGA